MALLGTSLLAHTLALWLAACVESHTLKRPAVSFAQFVKKYGRTYASGSADYSKREQIFSRHVQEMRKLNSRQYPRWKAGINSLFDWTDSELAALRGWRGGASPNRGHGALRGGVSHGMFLNQNSRGSTLPEEFTNWTTLGATQNVRDQGACGSCWAIASSLVLESHTEIYRPSTKRSFSAQDFLACVPNPHHCGGGGGCDGATVELAFDWAMHQGLASEDEEPYQGVTGTCRSPVRKALVLSASTVRSVDQLGVAGVHSARQTSPGVKFGMVAWERLPENKYAPLLQAVVEHGPVAVSVAASTWYLYSGGIFDHCPRDSVIDHAVTLLGFGRDRSIQDKFWLIQNSWGKEWGEQGRIRLLRRDSDDSEYCGIDKQPELGTGCTGGPKEVTVCGMCGILYDSVVPHFSRS